MILKTSQKAIINLLKTHLTTKRNKRKKQISIRPKNQKKNKNQRIRIMRMRVELIVKRKTHMTS